MAEAVLPDWSQFGTEPELPDWSQFGTAPEARGNSLDPNPQREPISVDYKPGFILTNLGIGGAQLAQLAGVTGGLVSGNIDNDLTTGATAGIEELQKQLPEDQKALEKQRADKMAAVKGEDLGSEVQRAGIAVWETLKSPTLMASFALQQVPQFAVIGPTARATAMVAEKIAARRLLEEAAAKKFVAKGAVAGGVATEAALQGGDAAQQTQQQLRAIPDEVWKKKPEIEDAMASYATAHPGASEADRDAFYQKAKNDEVLSLSRKSFAAAALIAVATTFIPGSTEIERALGGVGSKAVGSRAKRAGIALVGESLQQGIQEGPGGALVANVATAQVDPNKNVLEGVGEQTGMGAVFGVPGAIAAFINKPEIDEIAAAPTTEAAVAAALKAMQADKLQRIDPSIGEAVTGAKIPGEPSIGEAVAGAKIPGEPFVGGPTMSTTEVVSQAQARLHAINRKAAGHPAVESTDAEGNAVTIPAIEPEILTDAEKAERLHIRQNIGNPMALAQGYGINIAAGEQAHEYSGAQVAIDPVRAGAIQAVAQHIAPEDLADQGIEKRPHITIRHGLHTENPDDVAKVIADEGHVAVTGGALEVFKTPEADVLVQRVDSPDLVRLNKKLDALPNTQTFPDYKPHITIAYLKPGTGEKYLGIKTGLEGETMVFPAAEFTGKGETIVPLALQAPGAIAPVNHGASSGKYTISDAIGGEGPAQETVRLIVRPSGDAVIQREGDGQVIEITSMLRAGFSPERAIAQALGDDTTGKNVTRQESSQPETVAPEAMSYGGNMVRVGAHQVDGQWFGTLVMTPSKGKGNRAVEAFNNHQIGPFASHDEAWAAAIDQANAALLPQTADNQTHRAKIETAINALMPQSQLATAEQRKAAAESVGATKASKPLAVEDIHKLAESKGIPWDNNPEFMALTKRVTGKEHLDDLSQDQLQGMIEYLKAQPATKALDTIVLSMEHETDTGTAIVMQKADKVASRMAKRLKTIEAVLECVS